MCRVSIIVLVTLVLISKIFAHDTDAEYDLPRGNARKLSPYDLDEEYIHHIHSMINAYRSDTLGGRLVIETNALIDTKYRTWKRNADLINSLLMLPKGMNDAGR